MRSDNIPLSFSTNEKIIEYDMYGLIGIRLINPENREILKFEHQLDLKQTTLSRTPELSIKFIKSFSVDTINYLGLNTAGYADDKFYLLDKKNGNIKAQIPFETIGNPCKIICLSGLDSIPLLSEIIMFSLMKKNYLWLHASAFMYKKKSILVLGWEKGGKTESLLAFTNQNADYIGDEMVALSDDGNKMFGIPIPIAIWEWQLKYIPYLSLEIKLKYKIIFKIILYLEKFYRIFAKGRINSFFLFQLLDASLPALKRKLKIWVHPYDLFKNQKGKQGTTPDKVFLVMSHNNKKDIFIESCLPEEIAQRMLSSNEFERMHFFKYYQAFKFAFPNLRNEFLETIDERQKKLISHVFSGKESYKVTHPYPVSLDDLFNKMSPFCESKTEDDHLSSKD